MKYLKLQLLFAFLLLFSLSCKKESLPTGSQNEAVFIINNFVDGTKENIVAGDDGYYMFADFEKGTDTVYVFRGVLKQENCTADCGEVLGVEIRDFQKVKDEANLYVEQSLRCGVYHYSEKNPEIIYFNLYHVNLMGQSDGVAPLKYKWTYTDDFETGMVKNMQNPIINIALIAGSEVIGMEVIDKDGNMIYVEHKKIIGRGYQLCYADYSAKMLSNGKVELEAIPSGGKAPYRYEWSTGETSKIIEVDAKDAEYGLTIVSNIDGCFNLINKSIKLVDNKVNTISGGFTWEDDDNTWDRYREEGAMKYQFGKVAMTYKDNATGILYRSDRKDQPEISSFEILNVEDYDLNEKGQATKKLSIKYSCDVWSESGEKKHLNGEGTIAVAHP